MMLHPNRQWTFGIPTDGKQNIQFHDQIIKSIVNQKIPKFEIIFCVEQNVKLPDKYHQPPCRTITCELKKPKWITRKKNLIVQNAKYENLCLLHDYIHLSPQWFKHYYKFCEWDVCMNPVLSFGNRFLDWVSLDCTRYRRCGLIPYEVTDLTRCMYVSGSYFCVKKKFLMENPLNEKLSWGQGEDSEWSKRVRSFWKLRFNPNSPVHTLKKKR